MNINDYLNNHTFQFWLQENFDDETVQCLMDSIATDSIYPEAFVLWCYDAMAFDQEHTVYPILAEACGIANPSFEEEESAEADLCATHEFHFMEVPLHDDEHSNVPM